MIASAQALPERVDWLFYLIRTYLKITDLDRSAINVE
jgi:hypothetical protein